MRTGRPTTTKTTRGRRIGPVLAIMMVLMAALAAWAESHENQKSEKTDPWAVLRPLVGWWEGSVDGKLGTGRAVRRYQFVVGGKYLMSRHSSVRLPQEKTPKGDQHEELAVFSFDRQRQKLIHREFMIEGVVPRSVCETEANKIVCTTEAVEGGPGIRARLTLEIIDRYRFKERYELAWPGKELERYFDIQWTRKPVLDVWN